MSNQTIRMLLDTNVLIQTEDNKKIEQNFAELSKLSQQHPIQLFLHSGTIDDVNRDKNKERRDITLSKMKKYPLLEKIPCPKTTDLEAEYGPIKKDNDLIDVQLIHALKIKAVSFLITEDVGIHTRAKTVGLEDQVLLVSDAVNWLKQTYEPKSVVLPHVSSLKCHQVDVKQEIFQSLKDDYEGFEKWFATCIEQHRNCWTVQDGEKIIAIAILKEETGQQYSNDFVEGKTDIVNDGKVLKICTFKVGTDARGSKIGEHLLKQSLWHAYENSFDCVYLTAYEDKQAHLILFLKEFGFSVEGKNKNGELILSKKVIRHIDDLKDLSPLEYHKKYYPIFYDGEEVKKFFVPIEPQFHLKLFPEFTPHAQPMLFTPEDISKIKEEVSGNTIRKIYISRAKSQEINVGDLVLFYMSKNNTYAFSQCLTVVGVVDKITECQNLKELLEVTAKRSVYAHKDLEDMFKIKTTPVKAMDFFIAGHIKTDSGAPPTLSDLKKIGFITNKPPQSIAHRSNKAYDDLKKVIKITHGIENL